MGYLEIEEKRRSKYLTELGIIVVFALFIIEIIGYVISQRKEA